jgi:hypothetical protein
MGHRHLGRTHRAASAAAALAALVAAGCEPNKPAPPPSPGLVECGATNVFRPRNFSNPTKIDNKWLPLIPGRVFVFDGVANRGGGLLPHRVIFTVTNLTKVIDGVPSVVMWDRDYNNGVLQEAELAFFAQDDDGNIWTMGEYPEEYERGVFLGAPDTWFQGIAGADAGINVPGDLPLGTYFLQGWVPGINFLDCGQVYQLNVSTCVPFNCYEGVLEIDEWSPLEVGSGHQRKYYAPGVGFVRVGAVDDPEGETLVLVNLLHLTPEGMEEAAKEARKLEARAYEVSPVYAKTPPMR